jgi:hypothetical protein
MAGKFVELGSTASHTWNGIPHHRAISLAFGETLFDLTADKRIAAVAAIRQTLPRY